MLETVIYHVHALRNYVTPNQSLTSVDETPMRWINSKPRISPASRLQYCIRSIWDWFSNLIYVLEYVLKTSATYWRKLTFFERFLLFAWIWARRALIGPLCCLCCCYWLLFLRPFHNCQRTRIFTTFVETKHSASLNFLCSRNKDDVSFILLV